MTSNRQRLLLCACAFLAVLGLGLDLAFALPSKSMAEIYDSNVDEGWFLLRSGTLWGALRDGLWSEALGFGAPYGYGPLFWWISAAAIGAAESLGAAPFQTLVPLKLLFLAFKWGGLLLLADAFRRRAGRDGPLLLALLLASPIVWFYAKAYSPEFLLFFLAAATARDLACGRPGRAWAWACVAASVKILALILPAACAPFLIRLWIREPLSRTRLLGAVFGGCALGAALLAPAFATPVASSEFLQWLRDGMAYSESTPRAVFGLVLMLYPLSTIYPTGSAGLMALFGLWAALILAAPPAWAAAKRPFSEPLAPAAAALAACLLAIFALPFGGTFFDWYWAVPAACAFGLSAAFAPAEGPSWTDALFGSTPAKTAVGLGSLAAALLIAQAASWRVALDGQAKHPADSGAALRLAEFSAACHLPAVPLVSAPAGGGDAFPDALRDRQIQSEELAAEIASPVFLKYGRIPYAALLPSLARFPSPSGFVPDASGAEKATHVLASTEASDGQVYAYRKWDGAAVRFGASAFVPDWSDSHHALFVRSDLAACLPPAASARAPALPPQILPPQH